MTEKPWGAEHVIYSGEYTMKRLDVADGHRTSLQYHPDKVETMYVVSGTAQVTLGEAVMSARPGSSIHIPSSTTHRLAAPTGDVVIIECSTPVEDTVRIEDDYGRA